MDDYDKVSPYGYQALLCAVLENAMQESAKLRRLGFWEEDPVEMSDITSGSRPDIPSYVMCRLLDERMFWGGNTCQILLNLVCEVADVRVSRAQLVKGIRRISESGEMLNKRRGGNGGSIKI
jgi:hypothetical protein